MITFHQGTSDETSIDPASKKVAGTIAFGGEPEAAVGDGRGHIFVNLAPRLGERRGCSPQPPARR